MSQSRGRPKKRFAVSVNGMGVGLQGLSIAIAVAALALPHWLENPAGVSFTPFAKSWGFWQTKGRRTRSLAESGDIQCKIHGLLSAGLGCASEICKWYQTKCNGGHTLQVVSYLSGAVDILALLVMLGSIVCSLRRNLRTLRCATLSAFLGPALMVFVVVLYIWGCNVAFAMMNEHGYYPVPQPALCMWLHLAAIALAVFAFLAHCCRYRRIARDKRFEDEMVFEYRR
eukprot:Polyplicarium_translucidae@DN3974_c0_g1_i1.p1